MAEAKNNNYYSLGRHYWQKNIHFFHFGRENSVLDLGPFNVSIINYAIFIYHLYE